jgi:hypothetical protein
MLNTAFNIDHHLEDASLIWAVPCKPEVIVLSVEFFSRRVIKNGQCED